MTRDVVITCPFSSILWPCETTVTIEEQELTPLGFTVRAVRCSTGAELRADYPGWDVLLRRVEVARIASPARKGR